MTDWQNVELVPGQLHTAERYYFRDTAKRVVEEFAPDITIVNIGIWRGASCHALRLGAPKATIFGIDIMGLYPMEMDRDLHTYSDGKDGSLADFIHMTVIKRNSNYVEWDSLIHLLFIDGGHEFDVVLEDINRFAKKLVANGCVILHDSRRDEVQAAIDSTLRMWEGWEELGDQVGTLATFRRLV